MQDNSTKNVCRCCLQLVHSACFINGVMREMLSLLLIKLDLDLSEHPLVCGTCLEVLDKINLFKSRCLYAEDIINDHVVTNSKVSLRDMLIEMENKRYIDIGEDEGVCRLCIKIPLNGSYIVLGETGDGLSFIKNIQIHLPEVDLSKSEKPIICEVCHVQLKNYVSFATNCMAVEEKIKFYCDLQRISGPVDLACVLQFTEDKALELQNRLNKDLVIKQEDDSVMVKVEKIKEDLILEDHFVDSSCTSELYLKNEEIEIKPDDDMSEETKDPVPMVAPNNSEKGSPLKRKRHIRKSPSKGREYLSSNDHEARHGGRNKTVGCIDIDSWKGILTQNMVRHKSEVMHKCAKCEFETRRKSGLYQHMIVHRDPRAEKKFKCDQCPFETAYKSCICQHNLTHKDKSEVEMYKCANCDFETTQKRYLIPHMVTHRDPRVERMFKCDQCAYGTDIKSRLRTHNLIHKDKSEVEMHKCENCEYETRYKSNMIQHMVKHRDPGAERKLKCDKYRYEILLEHSYSLLSIFPVLDY